MSTSPRENHRIRRGDVPHTRLALFGALVVLGMAGAHHVVPGLLVEIALLGGLVYALAGFRPLRELYHCSHRKHRLLGAGAVLILILGQVLKASTVTFPVVGWTMYGAVQEEDPVVYEYEAIRKSGTREVFIPAQVLPALANARIDNRLKRQIAEIEEAGSDSVRRGTMERHAATLRALAKLANQRDEDPVVKLLVRRGTVPMRGYTGDASIVREVLWPIDIEVTP